MSASQITVPGLPGRDDNRRFRRALICAALLEAAGLVAVLSLHSVYHQPPPESTQPAPIRVRIVSLPPVVVAPPRRPEPKPKPHPMPRQVLPRPAPRPRKPQHRPLPAHAPTVHAPPPSPLPPMPVTAPMPVAPEVRSHATDRYAARLRAIIQAHVHLPAIVRALHLRGRAIVAFRLTPDGSLLWAHIVRSSGVRPIDIASVAEVHALSYPPFTSRMPKRPLTFTVAVHMISR